MAFKGNLQEVGLAEVCQLLSLGNKSGCLTLADQSRHGQIYFDDGRICFATVRNRRDRLGDLLVRDGVINYIQLLAVIDQQSSQPDKRIGELLIEHELISPQRLEQYVRLQIEEAVYHLLAWTQGTFDFEAGARPPAGDTLVSLSTDSLLLESARRTDEWEVIRQRIESVDLCFKADRERISDADVEFSADQEQILPYLDGTRSVQEVMELTGRTEFEAGKALYGLLQAGFVTVAGRRSGGADDAPVAGEVAAEQFGRGMAFYRSGMLNDAAEQFRGILETDPDHHAARFQLAVIALRQNRFRDALQELRPLINSGVPHAAIFLDLALALMRCGRFDQALLAVDHAETLREGMPRAALLRGSILLRQGRPNAAAASLAEYRRRLSAETPPTAAYYHEAALAEALAGRLDDAGELAIEGVAHHPESAPLLVLAGAIAERSGDGQSAETHYRLAAEARPTLPHAYRGLGDLAFDAERWDVAANHYERAVQSGPELGDVVYARLGGLHERRGNFEQATRYWEKALELNPENDGVRQSLRFIATHE